MVTKHHHQLCGRALVQAGLCEQKQMINVDGNGLVTQHHHQQLCGGALIQVCLCEQKHTDDDDQ